MSPQGPLSPTMSPRIPSSVAYPLGRCETLRRHLFLLNPGRPGEHFRSSALEESMARRVAGDLRSMSKMYFVGTYTLCGSKTALGFFRTKTLRTTSIEHSSYRIQCKHVALYFPKRPPKADRR
jgi:hypothetical protein